VACDRGTAPLPTLTGNWFGSGGGYVMDLSLTHSGQNVSGDGTLAGVTRTLSVNASGTFSHPTFALTMSGTTFTDFTFEGTLDSKGTTMTGAMNGSGFNDVEMILTRR
jgi:hypothetical protein